MALSKREIIDNLEQALQGSEEIYQKLDNEEITLEEAGEKFHAYVGDEVFRAISQALVYLKRDDKE